MSNETCERCGKTLGFFSRGRSFDNRKLNIHYQNLCGDCYGQYKRVIDRTEKIIKYIHDHLRNDFHIVDMGRVPIDTLIFTAVAAVFKNEPDFYDEKNILNRMIIGKHERSVDKIKDLIKIVRFILAYGFSGSLENSDLRDFADYFRRSSAYFPQIRANCNPKVKDTWVNAFVSPIGLILEGEETAAIWQVTFPEDAVIKYALHRDEGVMELAFNKITYDEDKERPVRLFFTDEKSLNDLARKLDYYNDLTREKSDAKRRNLMSILSHKIRNDIRKLKPNERLTAIDVDFIMIMLVKNFKEDPDVPHFDFNALTDPYGMAADILAKDYFGNFLRLGIESREDMMGYIRDNYLFAENFGVRFGDVIEENTWAFFSQKGYMLCLPKHFSAYFSYQDEFPNNVYYPMRDDYNIQDKRYLYLPVEEHSVGKKYRSTDGIIFYSEHTDVISEIKTFVNRCNNYYRTDIYVEEEQRIYNARENLLEVKRISDHLFRDFSYIPFCLYNEWAAIQNALAESDTFLAQFISGLRDGRVIRPKSETSYTTRIVKAFHRSAKELSEALNIEDVSVAGAILWSYFNDALIDTLSREWIRLGGDVVPEGKSLEQAFEIYLGLDNVDPDKAYYFGLFIYYLMSKKILPDDDFLSNYEKSLLVYVHCGRKLNYGDAVEIPAVLFENVPDDVKEKAVKTAESANLNQNIDEWAITKEEAEARAQADREHEKKKKKPKATKTVIQKTINDDGDIIDVAVTVPDDKPSDKPKEKVKSDQTTGKGDA